MTDETNTTLTSLFQALKEYNPDLAKSLFTEDATILMPQRPAYHGPDGAVDMVNDLSRTWVDWIPQPLRTISEDNTSAVEWTCTMTDMGGGQSRVDGCCVVDFQEAKIHRLRVYWRPEDVQG